MRRLLLLITTLLLCGGFQAVAQTVTPLLVEADGTEFKATLADGRVLRSPDLVGARLVIAMGGQAIRVRLDGVERDPDAKIRHGVAAYVFGAGRRWRLAERVRCGARRPAPGIPDRGPSEC